MTQETTLVRQYSKELEEEERQELRTTLQQCRHVLTPGDAEDQTQQMDLEEVGIRVQVLSRGDKYLYIVSKVLIPDPENHIREGHVLLKAGDTDITSFSPCQLHQFCQTHLTSSSVRLVFGAKDALCEGDGACDEVDYAAVKVGVDTVEENEVGSSVGSGMPACRTCCQSPLKNAQARQSVIKVSSNLYLESGPDFTLRVSCFKNTPFENHLGALVEVDETIHVSTLETWVNGRRMALHFKDQNDCLTLKLTSTPSDPMWPFYEKRGGRMIACDFLFRMTESPERNRFELRPLHRKDVFLCLDEDGVLVARRASGLQSSPYIFDIMYPTNRLPEVLSDTTLSPDGSSNTIINFTPASHYDSTSDLDRKNGTATFFESNHFLTINSTALTPLRLLRDDDLSPSRSSGDLLLGSSFHRPRALSPPSSLRNSCNF